MREIWGQWRWCIRLMVLRVLVPAVVGCLRQTAIKRLLLSLRYVADLLYCVRSATPWQLLIPNSCSIFSTECTIDISVRRRSCSHHTRSNCSPRNLKTVWFRTKQRFLETNSNKIMKVDKLLNAPKAVARRNSDKMADTICSTHCNFKTLYSLV